MKFIVENEELNVERWTDFVARHPHGSIFHTPEMLRVYDGAAFHTPVVCAAVDDSGEIMGLIVAVILREKGMAGAMSVRSILWGGPLIAVDAHGGTLDGLMRRYNRMVKSLVIYTQIRNLQDTTEIADILMGSGYQYEPHLNYLIDLTQGEELLFKNLHVKRRNEVRRAYKEGTTVGLISDLTGVAEAYDILETVYSSAKLPLADFSLFESAFKVLYPKEMIHFFGAYFDGNLIGVEIVFVFQGTMFNWYAGAKRDYYKMYPNDVLIWEAMKWGAENGMKTFDLGGAGRPDEEYGVRRFKKKFGGEEVEFGRYKKIHKPLLFNVAKHGYKLWQKSK